MTVHTGVECDNLHFLFFMELHKMIDVIDHRILEFAKIVFGGVGSEVIFCNSMIFDELNCLSEIFYFCLEIMMNFLDQSSNRFKRRFFRGVSVHRV